MVLCSLFIKLQMSHRKRVSQMLHGQGSGHVYSVQGQPMIIKPYWKKINWHFRMKITSFLCGVHTCKILYVPILMKQFMFWHGSLTHQPILFPMQRSWVHAKATPFSSPHHLYLIGYRKPQILPITSIGAAAMLPWGLGAGSFLLPVLCHHSEPSQGPVPWAVYGRGNGHPHRRGQGNRELWFLAKN